MLQAREHTDYTKKCTRSKKFAHTIIGDKMEMRRKRVGVSER